MINDSPTRGEESRNISKQVFSSWNTRRHRPAASSGRTSSTTSPQASFADIVPPATTVKRAATDAVDATVVRAAGKRIDPAERSRRAACSRCVDDAARRRRRRRRWRQRKTSETAADRRRRRDVAHIRSTVDAVAATRARPRNVRQRNATVDEHSDREEAVPVWRKTFASERRSGLDPHAKSTPRRLDGVCLQCLSNNDFNWTFCRRWATFRFGGIVFSTDGRTSISVVCGTFTSFFCNLSLRRAVIKCTLGELLMSRSRSPRNDLWPPVDWHAIPLD